ncbi:hypothetical protein PEDI_42000 [Persicobacter diffluens]|uniref:MetS family NSS transporter small subunit n=1 Tax=Persicobacter diffluens TaxID=981 RepID=A0AAN4W2X0_9BACT|nr:hypothetical protein PEDI_42000 [Persicobacter diffluens]
MEWDSLMSMFLILGSVMGAFGYFLNLASKAEKEK